jgi:hypothetical protein
VRNSDIALHALNKRLLVASVVLRAVRRRSRHDDGCSYRKVREGVTLMVNVPEMLDIAKKLRGWAQQIRRDDASAGHATAKEDAGLLDQAADRLEKSAAEIQRLRELIT